MIQSAAQRIDVDMKYTDPPIDFHERIGSHLEKSGGVLYVAQVACSFLPGCMSGERLY